MQNRDEKAGRGTSEPVLTTEDLAHPAPPGDRDPAVYPGEATGGRSETGQTPAPADGPPGSPEPDRDRGLEPGLVPEPGRDEFGERDAEQKSDVDRAAFTEPDTGSRSDGEPLMDAAEAERYRTTWKEIQGRFVDDPQEAVRSADTLVAEVMQTFAGTLSEHRSGLEKQWDRGEQVATEDLRQALRAYRSLINRLLDT
ncbi:hypothetical protein J7F03_35900 [Streptomyces sp. ISL-43]|uniref:hypothetical protein n=1 Tax=Streptomyces sp. ISL-43 TaxID=2819183 RepID=UPI001BE8DE36|nr:hypothetical protein [Streptomyces sp. ISL-43]MBT2452348.1 hypothetical protein [Streptomyces sp. ISL-43]